MIESVDMIIRQSGHPERVVKLQDGVTRLGRAEDNDVVLSDVGVSRRHARLVVTRDSVRVEDLGSGNGTYYRGFRIQSQQVEDGDELVIDPFVLQFRVKGSQRKQPGEMTLPVSGAAARLDVIAGAGLARTSYPIGPRGLTIGRSETRDVVIPDPAASRHHCSILTRDNAWVLRDMGSANGIFVNGVRARETVLSDGDRLRIGNTEMRFVIGDATQADSTTQRVPSEPWIEGDSWTGELSLPVPESPTPRGRARRSAAGRIVMGGLTLLALLLIGVSTVVVAVVGALVLRNYVPAGAATTAAVLAPPHWALEGLQAGAVVDVKAEQGSGMEALKSGRNREALASFTAVLYVEPGKPSAERLAFAAAEYLVLEALDTEMQAAATARATREARRDQLLAAYARGKRGRAEAAQALSAEFRDDPVVNAKLGWPLSEAMALTRSNLEQAAEKAHSEDWVQSGTLYAKALESTHDPVWRKQAQVGVKSSRRELARAVASEWRAGIAAEERGDRSAARSHFQKVLEADPGNPSARIRLARLGS